MAYKILYIEDLRPQTIVKGLEENKDFKVDSLDPESLDEILDKVVKYDLLLLDFRLTESKRKDRNIKFDAPTIASTLRTFNSKHHKDIPIILISTETNIAGYYKDFTSQDLFDYSVSKPKLLKNIAKYTSRFISIIKAYKKVASSKNDLCKILSISKKKEKSLDYRINMKLDEDIIKYDIFAFTNFIKNNIIRSVGLLIGEDILAARLGVSKESKDWKKLKELLDKAKYKGVFSDSYERWWSDELLKWWAAQTKGNDSLRRLNAEQRVVKLKAITGLKKLDVILKTSTAESSSFWTICKDTHKAIDPIDGFEVNNRWLLPWQDKEYISFEGISSDYMKYVKPLDKQRIREIEKSLGKR